MDTINYRNRLTAMRDCLREVEELLPSYYSEFICIAVEGTTASPETQQDVRNLIMRTIHPYFTFEGWVKHETSNGEAWREKATAQDLLNYRLRWINKLCADIDRQLKKPKILHNVP